jgi:hypothetical protein
MDAFRADPLASACIPVRPFANEQLQIRRTFIQNWGNIEELAGSRHTEENNDSARRRTTSTYSLNIASGRWTLMPPHGGFPEDDFSPGVILHISSGSQH